MVVDKEGFTMTTTPQTDSAERFIYDARGEPFGFIPSALGRNLERAFETMWRRGQAVQPPETFSVETDLQPPSAP